MYVFLDRFTAEMEEYDIYRCWTLLLGFVHFSIQDFESKLINGLLWSFLFIFEHFSDLILDNIDKSSLFYLRN